MELFKRRPTLPPESYPTSNQKSARSPRSAASPHNQPYDVEASRREKSTDSLDQVSKWGKRVDSLNKGNKTVYLETFSPEKTRARNEQEASGSDGDGSHGSEENWISGGEIHPHSKNVPGSVL
jgi:hypothetical protein